MMRAGLRSSTPRFHHLGEPKPWTCPKCGHVMLVYPALPVNHTCAPARLPREPRAFYFYYVLSEDHRVESLHLVEADEDDPLLAVESFDADGRAIRWARRAQLGELIFYPPDPENSREHVLRYDPRLQRHEPLPQRELERRATRGRHSA